MKTTFILVFLILAAWLNPIVVEDIWNFLKDIPAHFRREKIRREYGMSRKRKKRR